MSRTRAILYLAPTFLANRAGKQIRGVQVMDFQILSDLVSLGHQLCVPLERTWKSKFDEQLGAQSRAPNLEVVLVPALRKPLLTTVAAAVALRNRTFDVAIVGNVARGIVPGVNMMLKRGVFARLVIQANAAPKASFLKTLSRWPARVVAVSRHVADAFPLKTGGQPVDVYYGISNPDAFFPAPEARQQRPVRFCMLGKLDTALKGVEGVIRAFSALPQDCAARCELHLASYPRMPDERTRSAWGSRVIPYPWMTAAEIPGFLRAMDVLIIASASETYSQACVQAMLTGMPVIGRDLPAIREKLGTEAGICFKSQSELTDAMRMLACDPLRRAAMGSKGRTHALEHCVWKTSEFLDRFVFPSQAGSETAASSRDA
ncbi:MAG: glycosyltransferase family 4 protein [Phycisphaeraceae bacterium]|nr:glycosyltransferase family 4 protein [Phycisphaeraceae bacterium]